MNSFVFSLVILCLTVNINCQPFIFPDEYEKLIKENNNLNSRFNMDDSCEIVSEDENSCLGKLGGKHDDDGSLIENRHGIFSFCKPGYKKDKKGNCRLVVKPRIKLHI